MSYHCMVTAFARAFRMTPEELVELLPHDGLGKFPGTDHDRTHHVQEMIDVAEELHCYVTPIELVPQSTTADGQSTFQIWFGDEDDGNFKRFKSYLRTSTGVVLGMNVQHGIGHAVFNDRGIFVDHRGQFEPWAVDSYFSPGVYWKTKWTT